MLVATPIQNLPSNSYWEQPDSQLRPDSQLPSTQGDPNSFSHTIYATHKARVDDNSKASSERLPSAPSSLESLSEGLQREVDAKRMELEAIDKALTVKRLEEEARRPDEKKEEEMARREEQALRLMDEMRQKADEIKRREEGLKKREEKLEQRESESRLEEDRRGQIRLQEEQMRHRYMEEEARRWEERRKEQALHLEKEMRRKAYEIERREEKLIKREEEFELREAENRLKEKHMEERQCGRERQRQSVLYHQLKQYRSFLLPIPLLLLLFLSLYRYPGLLRAGTTTRAQAVSTPSSPPPLVRPASPSLRPKSPFPPPAPSIVRPTLPLRSPAPHCSSPSSWRKVNDESALVKDDELLGPEDGED